MEPHVVAEEQLHAVGQRYTSGRRRLVELLCDAGGPVTIPELIEREPTASQSSLYRNLAVLERCGVVRRVSLAGDIGHYELAEALSEHHHHLVCQRCGRVMDVLMRPDEERMITGAARRVAEEQGFALEGHRFEISGVCPDCRGDG